MSELPQADSADTDAVQMALQAAHTLWSRGDTTESLRWLKRAAESASDEGSDLRSLQLAKAAAELRAKLFPTTSDAPPPGSVRTTAQRELTGVRPAAHHDPLARDAESVSIAGASGGSEGKPNARPEESAPPSSRSPSSAPQYVVHRPREAQRQLMGLSSSTLETARQHNGSNNTGSSYSGSNYASVPSWSAGSEQRNSSPPPLPHSAIEEYEELDAEPVEDSDAHAAAVWASTAAPTWRPPESPRTRAREGSTSSLSDGMRRDPMLDSSPRVATLPPPSFQPSVPSSPPPLPEELPELSAFGEEDGDPMRPEQPTVVLPPQEERSSEAALMSGHAPGDGWDADPRMSNWDSGTYGWAGDSRSAGWVGSSAEAEPAQPSLSESVPPKLTARVHHQAVRVSFSPDSRASGQYVVRVLREGERPLAGERVALLVALEPGVPLV